MDLSHCSSFIVISAHHPMDEQTAAQSTQATGPRPHSFQGANMTVFFLFFNFIYFLFYFWLCWVFAALHRISLAVVCGGYSLAVSCGLLIEVASLAVEHSL